MEILSGNTVRLCVCASEQIKLIGSTDGFFPDMGHHVPKEMNGMWLHPIKLLDGFWFRLEDHNTNGEVNGWIRADRFINYPYGNKFLYLNGLGHTSMRVERFQFAPDGINGCIVSFKLTNNGTNKTSTTCEMLARTDLRSVWLSENIGIYDGSADEVEFLESEHVFLAKDNANEWYAAIGCDKVPDQTCTGQFFAAEITAGNGVSCCMTFSLDFHPGESKELVFYFAGSYNSREECLEQYRILTACSKYEQMLESKKLRYDNIRDMSAVVTPDSKFNEVFEWIKCNTDWLVVDVPGTGRGVTAGLPEYPFWFGCDGCFTVMGLLAAGRFDVAKHTLRVLRETSESFNGNGRIIHEVTTAGVVNNPGNTQETAQFINTVWEYFQWTGDMEFVSECLPYMKKSIKWLEEMDDDDDGLPSGYGVIEVTGLDMELIDTAVYTCIAYEVYGNICSLLNDSDTAGQAFAMSSKTKEAILRKFWLPEKGLFADTVTTAEVIKERLASTLYKWGPEGEPLIAYLEKEIAAREDGDNDGSSFTGEESGWLVNESWIIATPMETGLAPAEHARIALANMYTDRFLGQFGGFLSGLIHRSTMTITSNVYAVAQARYGYSDRALDILLRMFSTFSKATPGSISEMSPDYGCFVQGWTVYCATAIVKYFFGITPDVPQGKVFFSPCMPSGWDSAEIRNVRVGTGSLSVFFRRFGGKETYKIENRTGLDIITNDKNNITVEIIDLPIL